MELFQYSHRRRADSLTYKPKLIDRRIEGWVHWNLELVSAQFVSTYIKWKPNLFLNQPYPTQKSVHLFKKGVNSMLLNIER